MPRRKLQEYLHQLEPVLIGEMKTCQSWSSSRSCGAGFAVSCWGWCTCDLVPEVTATMATICATVRHSYPNIPLGVQILSAANKQALPVALAADADFIRVEGFVFSQISGEGFLDACAGSLLRYRKQIGAEHIQIFTDIKKKHSSHGVTSDISVAETARAAEFFLSDGVILTGIATGMQTNPKEPMEIKQAVRIPAFIGSGVSVENVEEYMAADAMIIGSHFKKAGYWANEVDFERIKKFMTKINQLRK
ncbi:hypothetical protein scyTo_0014854 [Scyliorhinus torazame]|uniref:BtpA family membrane complex biogenesis protein n=1 Tax=Scyliorhinus torazame TaxID=75743 RepID=A0A401NW86_SCYTO|nr:hypothetical protein [Scyliorhinus torazame]